MTERSSSIEQTRQAGARLARLAAPGDVYSLDGGLGSGKTEFVRGFASALADEAQAARVHSPTFSIVNTYLTRNFPVYHFDFYRIEDSSEFISIGLDEYIYGDGVCLIEWGGMFPAVLPDSARHINFRDAGNSSRIIEADFLF